MENNPEIVIAVDGPSGSGKSSASRGVASALGLLYLDTGAMYRALTWWLVTRGVDPGDRAAIAERAGVPDIQIGTEPDDPWVRVDGRDVSREIRTHRISTVVSAIASVPEVRATLIAQQREIIDAARPGIVAEGRDIGTVVAPGAAVKVFLTAGGAARASRHAADQGTSETQTEADHARRDRLDAAQSAKAPDAIVVDSTDLTLDEVVGRIVELARRIPERAC